MDGGRGREGGSRRREVVSVPAHLSSRRSLTVSVSNLRLDSWAGTETRREEGEEKRER